VAEKSQLRLHAGAFAVKPCVRPDGNRGKREFIQVLRLLEAIPMEIVSFAVTEAIYSGAIGFDAVKQIALARIADS